MWTFHSLRHVFATWALSQPGARIGDLSRLLGHSTLRVTLEAESRPNAARHRRYGSRHIPVHHIRDNSLQVARRRPGAVGDLTVASP